MRDAPRADGQHRQGAQHGQPLLDRVEDAAGRADRHVRLAQALGDAAEALGLRGLAPERLDDDGALEALVRDGGHVGPQLLRAHHEGGHPALEHDVDREDGGHDEQPHRPEHEVGREHRAGRDHDHHQDAEGHRQRRHDLPGGLDVGVGVGQQLARGVPVVPGQRQPQVLTRDRPPVPRLEPVHRRPTGRAPADHPDRRGQRDAGERPDDVQQLLPVMWCVAKAGASTVWVRWPSHHPEAAVPMP